jgi:pantoate--beta-alanine ligase
MRIVRNVSAMQALARKHRTSGVRIGFVPTMGWLHAGHISLTARARRAVGPRGIVVVSIFVNPTQFGPEEDFNEYPRDLRQDAELCREAGVDVIFAPNNEEMYPVTDAESSFSTYVVEENVSRTMEGEARPTHFRGVTTVVSKLFNIVDPDVAVFGQKDYQQAAVIQRMVRDLNFRTRIIVAPTVRERDGLAMSSRNQYLSAEERPQAAVLWRAIQNAKDRVRGAARGFDAGKLGAQLAHLIHEHPAARVDYISFFDPVSLQPVGKVTRGDHMALAVYVGRTRLIDNAQL